MANVVSFIQTNGEQTVSVAIGNETTAPQPKQHGVIAIVHRSVVNIRTVYESTNERHPGGSWIISVICLAVAIAQITIGSIHLHNCPVERFIPIYLVVSGVVGLVEMIRQSFCWLNSDDDDNDMPNGCGCLLQTFLFAWFIAGSVWVYSVWHKVNYHSYDAVNYCHALPYVFAMVQITLVWSLLALVLFLFIATLIFTCVFVAVTN